MTLDEAIKHCEEVVKEKNKEAYNLYDAKNYEESRECIWCAEEHEQLEKWLKELKELKEQSVSFQQINESAKFAISATGQSDNYCLGMCNGIEWMRGTLTNTKCNFFDSKVTK